MPHVSATVQVSHRLSSVGKTTCIHGHRSRNCGLSAPCPLTPHWTNICAQSQLLIRVLTCQSCLPLPRYLFCACDTHDGFLNFVPSRVCHTSAFQTGTQRARSHFFAWTNSRVDDANSTYPQCATRNSGPWRRPALLTSALQLGAAQCPSHMERRAGGQPHQNASKAPKKCPDCRHPCLKNDLPLRVRC